MITIIILIVSILLNIIQAYGIRQGLRTQTANDAFFEEMKSRLEKILEVIKEADLRGSFEADDEVGSVFAQIKAAIQSLDIFLIPEEDDET